MSVNIRGLKPYSIQHIRSCVIEFVHRVKRLKSLISGSKIGNSERNLSDSKKSQWGKMLKIIKRLCEWSVFIGMLGYSSLFACSKT